MRTPKTDSQAANIGPEKTGVALQAEIGERIRGTDLRTLCEKHPELGKVILDRLAGVIAERKRSQQGQVTSMLASGMRQLSKS